MIKTKAIAFARCALVLAWFCRPLFLSAQEPARNSLLQWMDDIAQQELSQRKAVIDQIHSVADADRRKQTVRKILMELLGGLPDYKGPLNARVTGQLQNDRFAIEKVIYESLPGLYVTANLYRPNQPGPYPAVLLQSGHTQEGKPEDQRIAANLALKGFVALAFDPIGQGEREQTYSRQLKGPLAGWSVPEHIQLGAQALLIGESSARYFIWDAMRSVDYLVSRPDVDPTRLGAAGCSGGGALTTFLGALDPRIKAVVPACFPNSYRLLFSGPDPDPDMSFPRFLASGLDTADFVELSAPTPWLIEATAGDYFTPAGARLVYEEAKEWYALYGARDRIAFFVGPGPHGVPLESREAIYQWMIRWLKNGQGDFHEQPVKLYTNSELQVTATGNVEDEPGSRKVYQFLSDDFQAKRGQRVIPDLLTELRRLKIPTDGSAPKVQSLNAPNEPTGGEQIQFESEPGIQLDATLYVPPSAGRKPAVLLVRDNTRLNTSTAVLAAWMARQGRVVLEVEPRDSPIADDHGPFVGNWLANSRANQIGLDLPALRAHDVLRAIDLLAARPDVDGNSIRAFARGVKGIWLLMAAAADPRIGKIWLDRTPYSLRLALENPMSTNLFDAVIPGFAIHWDLDDLVKGMGARPVLWTDPTNWMHRVVALGPPFRYRYVLGDATDFSDAQDREFVSELLR
ncbi:MAG TPA: acetylxylan esterase [Terriglobia bacterium]|nr:acetylxylan esterase [Terriglobia bacterium]